MSWVTAVSDWVLGLAGSPWAYAALYALAVIDGFFPPVPSETVVIALASLAVSHGGPELWLVALVAACGAFTGDQLAYTIGKRVDLRGRGWVRGRRMLETLDWAERALVERGAVFILAARYIPIGRVAVNMTAGGLHFPRARFTALAAIAAVTWAGYTTALGSAAGKLFAHDPWIGVAVGVVGGILLGLVMDPLLSWVGRRMGWQALISRPGPSEPGAAGTDADAAADGDELAAPEQPTA